MEKKTNKKRLVMRNKVLKVSLQKKKTNTRKDFFELLKRASQTQVAD